MHEIIYDSMSYKNFEKYSLFIIYIYIYIFVYSEEKKTKIWLKGVMTNVITLGLLAFRGRF